MVGASGQGLSMDATLGGCLKRLSLNQNLHSSKLGTSEENQETGTFPAPKEKAKQGPFQIEETVVIPKKPTVKCQKK